MRRFSFRLESLLRLRSRTELEARSRLADALLKLRRSKQEFAGVCARLEESLQELRASERGPGELDLGHIRRCLEYVGFFRLEAARRLEGLKRADTALAERRLDLLEARRARRSLELLRQRRRGAWRALGEREERAEFDEMSAAAYMCARGEEKK